MDRLTSCQRSYRPDTSGQPTLWTIIAVVAYSILYIFFVNTQRLRTVRTSARVLLLLFRLCPPTNDTVLSFRA